MPKLTNRLINKAAQIAGEAHAMAGVLTEAFMERYGVTYSDVDADSIIDVLDYGVSSGLTLEQCDDIMTEAGYPPINGST